MSGEEEPILCRSVAGALSAHASLLDVEAQRLLVFDGAATTEEFGAMAHRMKDRADYYRGIAQRLHDQKGIIRDCAMLVILLEHAAVYVKAAHEDLPWHTVYNTRAELLKAIQEHTKSA